MIDWEKEERRRGRENQRLWSSEAHRVLVTSTSEDNYDSDSGLKPELSFLSWVLSFSFFGTCLLFLVKHSSELLRIAFKNSFTNANGPSLFKLLIFPAFAFSLPLGLPCTAFEFGSWEHTGLLVIAGEFGSGRFANLSGLQFLWPPQLSLWVIALYFLIEGDKNQIEISYLRKWWVFYGVYF